MARLPREIVWRRNDRIDAAFRQGAVADFAASGSTNRTHFTDGKGREVVIEHEFLRILFGQTVNALFVAGGSQRHRDQCLGFAPLEDSRSMGPWQNADMAFNRS